MKVWRWRPSVQAALFSADGQWWLRSPARYPKYIQMYPSEVYSLRPVTCDDYQPPPLPPLPTTCKTTHMHLVRLHANDGGGVCGELVHVRKCLCRLRIGDVEVDKWKGGDDWPIVETDDRMKTMTTITITITSLTTVSELEMMVLLHCYA